MTNESKQPGGSSRTRQILIGSGVAILIVAVAVYGLFAASWEASSGRILSIEKAGDADTEVDHDEQDQTVNLTEADLDDLPQLRRAVEEANRTGHASITEEDEIAEVCRFLEPRTEFCGGQLVYKGYAYKVGTIVK